MQQRRGGDAPLRDGVRRARAGGGVRPAVVHARGRGRPLRARDARERARALRDGRLATDATARFHTRSGELRADARGRRRRHARLPRRGAGSRAADARAVRRARARRRARCCAPTASSSCCVVADAGDGPHARARLRRARARSTDVRGVYVSAPGDDGLRHRVAVLRAPGRDRRGPGDGLDALRARRVLGSAPRPRRAARVPGIGARRRGHGRCARATARCSRAGPRPCWPVSYARERCQASCARSPSRSETSGFHPSSSPRAVGSSRRCGTRRPPGAAAGRSSPARPRARRRGRSAPTA